MAEGVGEPIRCKTCAAPLKGVRPGAAVVCRYCGTETLIPRPEPAAPFSPRDWVSAVEPAIDEDDALARLRRWLRSSLWAPGDLSVAAEVEEQAALLVPWWEVWLDAESHWKGADSQQQFRMVAKTRRSPRTGQREAYQDSEPFTTWHPVASQHFENCYETAHASEAVAREEMDAIGPWASLERTELSDPPPKPWTREEPTFGEAAAVEWAKQIVDEKQRVACAKFVERLDHVATRFTKVATRQLALPVWTIVYSYRGKTHRVLMNAHTGQLLGTRPRSWLKIAVVAGVSLLVASVGILVGWYLLAGPP